MICIVHLDVLRSWYTTNARVSRARVSVDPEQEKECNHTAIVNLIQNSEFSGIVKMSCFFFFLLWITINYFILRVVLSLKYIPISRSSSLPSWRFLIFAWILNFNLSNVKINISSLSLTWGVHFFLLIDFRLIALHFIASLPTDHVFV